MRKAGMIVVAVLLGGAAAVVNCAPVLAAGSPDHPFASPSLLQALGSSALSNGELSRARGGRDISLNRVTNTTTDTLNVDAASSGTVNGGEVLGSTTGSASGSIVNSQGIINQFANTGSNVMINSSLAIFINTQ